LDDLGYMSQKVSFLYILIGICINSVAFATDARYCGEPARDYNGNIIRSKAVIEEFTRLYPLPPHFKRSDFQINHAIPRVCGGCDSIENLIWMHVKAKTCADDYCQDRHVQLTMCPKSFHK
jgi:hypothetical protein